MNTNEQTRLLIDQVLKGDTEKFNEIVCLHQDRLYRALVHFTGAPSQAEDFAQEAFLRAYTKLHTFQRKANFYTWLCRIAINVALATMRRRSASLSLDQLIAATGEEPISDTESPWTTLERQEKVAFVRVALGRLDELDREILVLRELEELDYRSISDALQIKIGTVRSRLSRARQRLSAELHHMAFRRKIAEPYR